MRTAYIVCDRCGVTAQTDPVFHGEGWFRAVSCSVLGKGLPGQDLHLCPTCSDEFQTWMTRVPTEAVA